MSNLSSDEVNSISDSPESLQVATIIKQKYFDIIARGQLNEHDQPFQLDPSLDPSSPVLMYIPEGIGRVDWIKYFNTDVTNDAVDGGHDINTDITSAVNATTPPPGYQYITMLPVREFVDLVNKFNPSESTVDSFTFTDTSNGYPGSFNFYYNTDRNPRFCTIISNYYVIFDSYDNTQDTTLQASKTMAFGQVVPTFRLVDTFIPILDDQQFPLLVAEAKSLAFYELKQQPHQLAMQETKRQWSAVSKSKNINNRPTPFDSIPNYGRYGRGFRSATNTFKDRGWDSQ